MTVRVSAVEPACLSPKHAAAYLSLSPRQFRREWPVLGLRPIRITKRRIAFLLTELKAVVAKKSKEAWA